jgi:ribosomal protein S18 acetylase RimI-like enzyme
VDAVERTLRYLDDHPIDDLVVDELTVDDLDHIRWSGSATHVRNVAQQLERVPSGDVVYLAIRSPDGEPVAKGGVDFTAHARSGTIWQLATREGLEGRGLARRLIAELERRILDRDLAEAWIGVEPDNARARAIYERLGYELREQRVVEWEAEQEDGTLFVHRTTIIELARALA